ncbi:TPA: hypothetical protein JW546_003508 [Escherichia coli]|nr:hypothetical protein [Escherichia coli]
MFGMSITQPDGSLWMSPEFTPQNLINKGTMGKTKNSVFKTSIPQNKSCFFFIKSSNKANLMFVHEYRDGMNALRLHQVGGNPGTITVYAFSDMVLPHSGYGIAMYNPAGEMVYHGEMMPLDAELVTVNVQFSKDMGYPCAIMPAMVGVYNWRRTDYDRPVYVTMTGATGNQIYNGEWYSSKVTWDVRKLYTNKVLVINTSKYDQYD